MITHKKLGGVYKDIECPLILVLAKMERRGIFVDSAELATISEKLGASASTLASEIYEIAGEEFNVNSTQQLRKLSSKNLKYTKNLA